MKQTKISKPTHIVELDGLRGIAAIAVFFHHLAFTSINPSAWNAAVVSLYNISRYGLYGVDLFFVLSGYLITSLLLHDRRSTNYFHNFYWKRALRILPVYIISLIAVWIWIPGTTGGVVMSAFFLANFAGIFHANIGGPYWTLAIEEQFYLIWPQFVRRIRVDRLQNLAMAIVILEPILRLAGFAFHHHDLNWTFFRCDGLALGAVLACQCHRKALAEQKSHPVAWKRLSAVWLLPGVFIFLVGMERMMHSTRFYMEGSALFLSAINLFFYSLIRIAVQDSGVRYLAIFRSAALVFFGQISYCMYMSHTYVMALYDRWASPMRPGNELAYATRIVVVLAATVLVSVISRYALELPFMSLRKYVLRKPATAVQAEIQLPTWPESI